MSRNSASPRYCRPVQCEPLEWWRPGDHQATGPRTPSTLSSHHTAGYRQCRSRGRTAVAGSAGGDGVTTTTTPCSPVSGCNWPCSRNQPGTAVLCTGRNPRLDAGGKYGYPPNGWLERPYAYEAELDLLAAAAAKDMDIHACSSAAA